MPNAPNSCGDRFRKYNTQKSKYTVAVTLLFLHYEEVCSYVAPLLALTVKVIPVSTKLIKVRRSNTKSNVQYIQPPYRFCKAAPTTRSPRVKINSTLTCPDFIQLSLLIKY